MYWFGGWHGGCSGLIHSSFIITVHHYLFGYVYFSLYICFIIKAHVYAYTNKIRMVQRSKDGDDIVDNHFEDELVHLVNAEGELV